MLFTCGSGVLRYRSVIIEGSSTSTGSGWSTTPLLETVAADAARYCRSGTRPTRAVANATGARAGPLHRREPLRSAVSGPDDPSTRRPPPRPPPENQHGEGRRRTRPWHVRVQSAGKRRGRAAGRGTLATRAAKGSAAPRSRLDGDASPERAARVWQGRKQPKTNGARAGRSARPDPATGRPLTRVVAVLRADDCARG